jgi:hypothetical protein
VGLVGIVVPILPGMLLVGGEDHAVVGEGGGRDAVRFKWPDLYRRRPRFERHGRDGLSCSELADAPTALTGQPPFRRTPRALVVYSEPLLVGGCKNMRADSKRRDHPGDGCR